jgi:uncharacterized glyoxalase superfamily metalloenzyme YdcJ
MTSKLKSAQEKLTQMAGDSDLVRRKMEEQTAQITLLEEEKKISQGSVMSLEQMLNQTLAVKTTFFDSVAKISNGSKFGNIEARKTKNGTFVKDSLKKERLLQERQEKLKELSNDVYVEQ